jgi:oligopeptidase A
MNGTLKLPSFSLIDVSRVEPQLTALLDNANTRIKSLESLENPGWENLVFPLDLINDEVQRFWSPIRHLNSVMNSDELRSVYNACKGKLSAWQTELGQNQALFSSMKTLSESSTMDQLSAGQQKAIHDSLLNFKLGGVALEGEQKIRFKAIALELSQLSSQFQDNVLDATKAWEKLIEDSALLSGLPQSSLDLAAQAASNNDQTGYRLTLEFPSYYAVMTFADDRALREEMYSAYTTRASDQGPVTNYDNASVIERIIALRQEKAALLGFENYAAYSIASKMVDSPEQVVDFIQELAEKAGPQAKRDYRELADFARQEHGIATLEPWDISYYSNKLRKQRYAFSEEDLKPYFPASVAVPGLFAVTSKLFNVTITEIADADVWHDDVRLYQITDSQGRVRGAFYMDNYARENKRGGAWMDVCVGRMRTPESTQLPVAYLTCNLTPPVGDAPALLTHSEVTTLFHEFGHGLHHMLTMVDYPSVAGISGVEWDAVELPSQFLENWCWERESLDMISGHYETGEKLPQALLDKARAAKNFQSGLGTVRQLEFGLFDMQLHRQTKPLAAAEIQQLLDGIRADVAAYQVPQYVRFQNAFSHIFAGGYAAGYFSYKWAEVLSADAFSRFEETGIFDQETGNDFLRCILEKGGTQKAIELFVEFRGREPKIDALLRHTGLAA